MDLTWCVKNKIKLNRQQLGLNLVYIVKEVMLDLNFDDSNYS